MKNYINVNKGETVIWEGKPARKVSVLEGIFNGMLPFALIWLGFDSMMILMAKDDLQSSSIGIPLAGFFLIHLMPVWIYLFGIFTAGLKAKHTQYVVTDRAVYIQKGIFTVSTERSPLNEVNHTGIHLGIMDRICGTGDVVMECVHDVHNIQNIEDYDRVCELVSQISQDQYTDAMFPNDMRPEENHGYNTKYIRK